MAVITDPRIEQAKQLIQQKKRDEARTLLVSYLKTSPKDTNALYLYAFVARNPDEAKRVLRQVLDINPMHYQARAALNKIENRSVEQTRPAALPPQRTVWTEQPQFSRNMMMPVVGAVAVTFILIALALIVNNLLAEESEEAVEATQEVAAVVVTDATATDSPTPVPPTATRSTVSPAELAKLQATWTPIASPTLRPTRTLAPTMTPRPTRTKVPTLTPTQPAVEALTLDLESATRLYIEYSELAAQASWSKDPAHLDNIHVALTSIIASLEISDYTGVSDDLQDFLEVFTDLLNEEQDYVLKRKSEVELEAQFEDTEDTALQSELEALQDEVETLAQNRLEQQENIDRQFRAMVDSATATATFREQVESLKTPSATPIIIPTATVSQQD